MQSAEITRLLRVFSEGDTDAMAQLLPVIYDELRAIAHRQLQGERPDHTLNTTALVHETYLKLINSPPEVDWQGRAHFFAIAARAMRQVLVNYARDRAAQKRGGGVERVSLDEAVIMPEGRAEELVALDEALNRLERMNERQARIVECRYFSGLTIAETAAALNVSASTANREWTTARLWLFREVRRALGQADEDDDAS